jgi:hypothetical protein
MTSQLHSWNVKAACRTPKNVRTSIASGGFGDGERENSFLRSIDNADLRQDSDTELVITPSDEVYANYEH